MLFVFKSQEILTLEDGTDRLSQNVGKELPPYAVQAELMNSVALSAVKEFVSFRFSWQRGHVLLGGQRVNQRSTFSTDCWLVLRGHFVGSFIWTVLLESQICS